jgi:cytochrome c biogenesis protein CcmG/thiol:disulfide interchange protein DsbE
MTASSIPRASGSSGFLFVCLFALSACTDPARQAPVVVGGPAPEFSAFDLNGASRSLDDYRGKVVLLNLWATWCAPCKAEMPSMQRLHEQIQDEDFQILAVSIDRPLPDHDPANPLEGKLQIFAESLGLTFTILHDPTSEISTAYQTTGLPASFIVDREGIIVKTVSGPMDWDAPPTVQLIQGLLDGETPPVQ